MPHAAHTQNILQKMIKGNKRNDTTTLIWNEETNAAFSKCKEDLANAATLAYPSPHARLAPNVDASNHAIGGVLQQIDKNVQQPLGFISKCLSPCLQKASTYDRELYAIYESVRYF